MEVKNLIIVFCFCLIPFLSEGQSSFGVEFGRTFQRSFGIHQLDSIVVIPNGEDYYDSWSSGLFFESKLSEKIAVSYKANFNKTFSSFLVYNSRTDCNFCPVIKVGGISTSRLSFEILPQFVFLEFRRVKMSVFAGFSGTKVFKRGPSEDVEFNDAPGVGRVINSLDSTPIPFLINFAYGGFIEYGNGLIIGTKWLPTRAFSKEISIDNGLYPFENRWNFFSFTLGYKFHSFKFKNTLKEARKAY